MSFVRYCSRKAWIWDVGFRIWLNGMRTWDQIPNPNPQIPAEGFYVYWMRNRSGHSIPA
jgi:hypothetical protein